MNIQPQPQQSAQLHQQQQPQQNHLISNHQQQQQLDLRASSPANQLTKQINSATSALGNNNSTFLITNQNAAVTSNQQYFIQGQDNNNSPSVMTAVKQPLQQQQFQQFANQNNEIQQQQQQQQFQPQIANNLKYYMTNSPVSNQQIQQPTRIINVQNNALQQQQGHTYMVNQEQQNQQQQTNNNNIIINQPANAPTTTAATMQNSNGQIFLNINNRIVPIQALNLKQQQQQQGNQTITNNTTTTTTAATTLNTNLTNANQVVHSPNQGQRIQILGAVNSPQQATQQLIQMRPIQQQQPVITSSSTNELSQQQAASISTTDPITATASPTVNTEAQSASSLSAEITEKMRQLENIQKQLRVYQVKIASTNIESDPAKVTQTSYTSQQIQSALTVQEQAILQKLIIQRKTVQTEVQSLQQKLLTPNIQQPTVNSTPAPTTTTTTATTTTQSPTPLTKLQLYQQVLIKLNNFKNSKTVTIQGSGTEASKQLQQQLQLTTEEFDQLKKLLELQNQLQNELNLTTTQIQTIQTNLTNANLISKPIANQTIQIINSTGKPNDQQQLKKDTTTATVAANGLPSSLSSGKPNEWTLPDKYKVLELVKNEMNKLKVSLNQLNVKQEQMGSNVSQEILSQQQLIKERYIILLKKQTEVQNLINQHEKQPSTTDSVAATIAQVSSPKFQPQSPQVVNVSSTTTTSTTTTPQTIHIVNNSTTTKQAPIKIRNLATTSIATTSPGTLTTQGQILTNINKTGTTSISSPVSVIQRTSNLQAGNGTPLRALVINNNNNSASSPAAAATTIVQSTPMLVPIAQVAIIQKQFFPELKFKCLSFEELGQNSVITKQTDSATIDLIKELDNRAAQLVNPEQLASFSKNQVKLVRKFLEQQQLLKTTIRNRFQAQIVKEQRHVTDMVTSTALGEFTDRMDVIKRLAPFHLLQKTEFEPSSEEHKKFDECFEQVSQKLLKKADAMKKRFHLFQLRSMQKEVISSEETLTLKLFVDDLKKSIEDEKKVAAKETEMLNEVKCEAQTQNFKNLITSGRVENDFNVNNDFNLIVNPLKRQLDRTDDLEDDPCDFQDEPSVHRTIKYHSPNFTNKVLQTTTPAATSFAASSSSSSSSSSDPSTIISNVNTSLITIKTENKNSSDVKPPTFLTNVNLIKKQPTNNATSSHGSSDISKASGLNELVLNEEELAVQSIIDY